MESLVSKIQETGQHAAKKRDVVVTRTREAGEAFVGEVVGAGRDLVGFVRTEAKGWRRFFTLQTTSLQNGARELFTAPALERELWTRVDGTLKTIDARVQARLLALDAKKEARAARRKTTNGKGTAAPVAAKKGKGAAAKGAPAAAPASIRH